MIWEDYIGESKIDSKDYFKQIYCIEKDVSIEFMGLFDTVYGVFFGKESRKLSKIFFSNREVPRAVKTVVQLLAIHETRAAFRPILFSQRNNESQMLQQIWMPGVHSDIGGGYVDDYFSNVSLATMLERIMRHTRLKLLNDSLYELGEAIANNKRYGRLIINNEYEAFIFKLQRLFKNGSRYVSDENEGQFIHSMCINIRDSRVYWKKKDWRFFEMPKWELPIAQFDPSLHGDGR